MSDEQVKRIVYNAEPSLKKFHSSNAFFRGVRGPVGSGKTSACIMELYTRALEQKPWNNVRRSRWVLIRNTYPELLSTTLKTFQDWVPSEICTITRSPSLLGKMELALADGTFVEAEFLFLALDTEEDANKLKSLEVTGAYINEASEIRESVLKLLTSRVGRAPSPNLGGASWSGIIADTNPPADDHWWYRLAEIEKPQGYSFFSQPPALLKCYPEDKKKDPYYIPNQGGRTGILPAENVDHLPGGFDYYLRQVPGKDQDWIKVFILNEYGSLVSGKPVFPEYSDAIHVAKDELKPYPGLPLLIGLDFGLTPACVICQETPRGQLRILDELVSEGMGIERFARDLLSPKLHSKKYMECIPYLIGDPAGSQRSQTNETTCFDILELQGFRVEAAPSNEFMIRRESVAWFLSKLTDGEPGLVISPQCQVLRKALMGGYKYRKMRVGGTSDKYAETPDKNEYSHCVAKGSLVSTTRGLVPIEQVVPFDEVLTPLGPKQVLRSCWTRSNAEVVELEVESGLRVTLTPDHKVFSSRGWKRVDELQYSDVLYSINNNQGEKSWLDQQSIQFKSSGGNGSTESLPDITSLSTGSLESVISTGQYGLRSAEQYLPGTPFTIPTETKQTVESKTCVVSPGICTQDITPRNEENSIPDGSPEGWTRPDWERAFGMVLKQDELGTPNTGSIVGIINSGLSTPALSVETSTSLSTRPSNGDFVHPLASQPGEGNPELTMSPELVRNVEDSTQLTGTQNAGTAVRIVCMQRVENTEVYDLTVEGAHCFYANGILVHNCSDALQYACSWLRGASMEREGALAPLQTSARREIKVKSMLAYS